MKNDPVFLPSFRERALFLDNLQTLAGKKGRQASGLKSDPPPRRVKQPRYSPTRTQTTDFSDSDAADREVSPGGGWRLAEDTIEKPIEN